jgi:hypothetical protein
MVIDQRNGGASVTPTNQQFTLDRWQFSLAAASKITTQQNQGSITPPVGFSNYLGITSSSAYAISAGENFNFLQKIEGFNVADLGWGTANAKTVTLSFQVYSSLTGNFGGSLRNSGASRTYPFTYSIPTANTWTSISITIAGDTTGTWLTTNGVGIEIWFGLGVGSTFSGPAGAWSSSNYLSSTGATSVVGTNGATLYITGVQLEVGSSATSFEYRPYGTELVLCQRYCQKSYNYSTVPGANISSSLNEGILFGGWGTANVPKLFMAQHQTPLRPGTQSLSFWDVVGNASRLSTYDSGFTRTDNQSATGGTGISENKHFVAPGTSTANGFAWAYLITSEL